MYVHCTLPWPLGQLFVSVDTVGTFRDISQGMAAIADLRYEEKGIRESSFGGIHEKIMSKE